MLILLNLLILFPENVQAFQNKEVNIHLSSESMISYNSSASVIVSSIDTDKNSPQNEGTSVNVTANATGGSSLLYRLWVFDGVFWKVVQDYSSSYTYKWTPSTYGSYRIWIDVKDVNYSENDVDSSKEILYTIRKSSFSDLSNINHGYIIRV